MYNVTIEVGNGIEASFAVDMAAVKGEQGIQGVKGDTGKGFTILGTYATLSALEAGVTDAQQGDFYNVGTEAPYHIYMWDDAEGWQDQGQLQGPTGAQGEPGPAGPNTVTAETATTLTGLLKGDGTTVSAAVAGTDYVAPVEGKGLSSNDFTDAYKAKIDQNATDIAAKQAKITVNGVLQGDGDGNITEANPKNLTAGGYAPLLLCRESDEIDASSDLNTEEFLYCGSYLCRDNAKAESLVNCPTKKAFLMYVCCPTSNLNVLGAWTYRVRKIINMMGEEFIQRAYCGGTVGVYTWGNWVQVNTNIPQGVTATLTVAGWSGTTQTVSVTGVTANSILTVTYAPASHDAWLDAGVYCSAQGAGTLTFTCESVPSAALTANIVILA